MVGKRSGKSDIWVVLILLALAATTAGVFVSIERENSPHNLKKKPEIAIPVDNKAKAAAAWKRFVDEARTQCVQSGSACSVDYTALEHNADKSYGIMIVGYKDSEYELDVFRYDPDVEGEWAAAPKIQDEHGFSQVDVDYTAQSWKLPKETLQKWLSAANHAVKIKYSRPG